MAGINGPALTAIGVGAAFAYAGVKGYSIPQVIQAVVQGKTPAGLTKANPITSPGATTSGSDAAAGDTSAHSTSARSAQALAKLSVIASHPSWATGQEWADWVSLWNQESGWSNTAQNPDSGAYGIPQALPYTKMPKAAWPPADGGSASTLAQIQWGIGYIAQRYGSPSAAWAHEVANGWY